MNNCSYTVIGDGSVDRLCLSDRLGRGLMVFGFEEATEFARDQHRTVSRKRGLRRFIDGETGLAILTKV
jgi:hypothetical protein